MKKLIITSLFVGMFLFKSFSQEILIADGSSSGTYKQFLKEMTKVIADNAEGQQTITFTEIDSKGALENFENLYNNKCSLAFMHSDVLAQRSKTENLDNFKTVLALFNEEVHVLTLTTSKTIVGGHFGIGGEPLSLRDITDLNKDINGQKAVVGAAGGGFITAKSIQSAGEMNYKVRQYESGKDVLAALESGEIQAAIFVGAAPLPNLENLNNKYKLLPIPSSVADKMKMIYKPATVTYNKMSPNSVPTVSAQCLLVGKVYKTPKMINSLSAFRSLFFKNLDAIKETPGTHKAWAEVLPEERGLWPWMELPTNSVTK